jgi:hypothetical protein
MAEDVTDKDVERARKRVDKLNEQIANERQKVAATAQGSENTIRKTALDTEADRLEAELAALKDANKASTVNAAVSTVVDQVESGGTTTDADRKE